MSKNMESIESQCSHMHTFESNHREQTRIWCFSAHFMHNFFSFPKNIEAVKYTMFHKACVQAMFHILFLCKMLNSASKQLLRFQKCALYWELASLNAQSLVCKTAGSRTHQGFTISQKENPISEIWPVGVSESWRLQQTRGQQHGHPDWRLSTSYTAPKHSSLSPFLLPSSLFLFPSPSTIPNIKTKWKQHLPCPCSSSQRAPAHLWRLQVYASMPSCALAALRGS